MELVAAFAMLLRVMDAGDDVGAEFDLRVEARDGAGDGAIEEIDERGAERGGADVDGNAICAVGGVARLDGESLSITTETL